MAEAGVPRRALVVGLGVTGFAVAGALLAHDVTVVAVDDRPTPELRARSSDLGIELVEVADPATLRALLVESDAVFPSPGVPESHPVFGLADAAGVPVRSEFDLAAAWDDRPCLAITGTDGKTTVTMMVTAMLEASGIRAVSAGNVEVPLVAAIVDPAVDVFVVEASSFRLARATAFRPRVATWLNVADDHQDVHASRAGYHEAKARIWRNLTMDDLAVANVDDAIVMGHATAVPRLQTFGLGPAGADWHVELGRLRGPEDLDLIGVGELRRAFPHDIANALAAAATASGGGATDEAIRETLRAFRSLPHRVELVGEAGGVRFFDDSKATAPHATLAAISGFPSAVLIAGGRNKGLDLSELVTATPHTRAVVAIGEAASEVADAFVGHRPVVVATSMDDAVRAARRLAEPGDVVLLSPACASFDWYASYSERGDDFQRAVRDAVGDALVSPSA
ncbi:MAG: UDP-N-acetylmuramoyl-L-alanine--D-glutamate ligase [Actinomycetota bacterium]|nr:UDP-N-acetylmuramoyl-L-alanine--D-glutamate ligase [Actinomycetota bacterium]